jgi:CheY-like chemotaxis protein
MAGMTLTAGRKRILIIDDDLHLLFAWRAALAYVPHQCVVDTAQNGCEALEKMASLGTTGHGAYDLIIMDSVMPHMNGPELTQTVHLLYGDIPIVWLTSHRCPDIETKAQEMGVYCHLDKPISLALMRQVVWEALEATKAYGERKQKPGDPSPPHVVGSE